MTTRPGLRHVVPVGQQSPRPSAAFRDTAAGDVLAALPWGTEEAPDARPPDGHSPHLKQSRARGGGGCRGAKPRCASRLPRRQEAPRRPPPARSCGHGRPQRPPPEDLRCPQRCPALPALLPPHTGSVGGCQAAPKTPGKSLCCCLCTKPAALRKLRKAASRHSRPTSPCPPRANAKSQPPRRTCVEAGPPGGDAALRAEPPRRDHRAGQQGPRQLPDPRLPHVGKTARGRGPLQTPSRPALTWDIHPAPDVSHERVWFTSPGRWRSVAVTWAQAQAAADEETVRCPRPVTTLHLREHAPSPLWNPGPASTRDQPPPCDPRRAHANVPSVLTAR